MRDTYMEPTVIKKPNATIRVYRPILTEEERKRRMARINDAAIALLRSK